MAVEDIGILVPTKIPALIDDANIQDALKAYHYGSYDFDPAETNPEELLSPSIAYTINNLQDQIDTQVDLELAARNISSAQTSVPLPEDFVDFSDTVPDGYIWVDKTASSSSEYFSATSIYTSTEPSTGLANGVIWIKKDSVPLEMYVYNSDTSSFDQVI
jgi:hypothetical protein